MVPYLLIIVAVFISTRDMGQDYLSVPMLLKVILALLGCAMQTGRLMSQSHFAIAGQRHDVIQNRRPLPEDAEPLMQDLPEEYQWNPAPPRPQRREQESSQGQMVPVEHVSEILEPIMQQQEQRWQNEVGVAVVPLMSKPTQC